MTRFLGLAAVAAMLAAMSVGYPAESQAQGRTWFVWINVSTQPATIGVADSSYNVPGWTTLAGPFADDRAAWVEGCRLHFQPQYNSPDIAAGRVYC